MDLELKKKIRKFIEEEELKSLEFEERMKLYERERVLSNTIFHLEVVPCLKIASIDDYMEWLVGYLQRGGRPTHLYHFSFYRDKWYKAVKNVKTAVALYGASSINIIVPKGIEIASGNWGHSAIFFVDGYRVSNGTVHLYMEIAEIFKDDNGH